MDNKVKQNKSLQDSLLGGRKETVVETKQFQICGHLLRWEDTVIQISNISLISTGNFQSQQFPMWAAILALLGLLALGASLIVGLMCIVVGIFCIYLWYKAIEKTKEYKYLNIYLNSGRVFSLLFEKEWFLREVLDVFANIFEGGGTKQGTNISIDIQNCTVDNQSTLIGTLSNITR